MPLDLARPSALRRSVVVAVQAGARIAVERRTCRGARRQRLHGGHGAMAHPRRADRP